MVATTAGRRTVDYNRRTYCVSAVVSVPLTRVEVVRLVFAAEAWYYATAAPVR